MNFRKEMHEEAVSPVIGVILMVAITVVLAAVVGMYVMGQAEALPDSKSVTITATANATHIKATIVGGSDLGSLDKLFPKWDGMALETDDNAIWNGKSVTASVDQTEFASGDTLIFEKKGHGTLTIRGTFTDGSEALLLTKDF